MSETKFVGIRIPTEWRIAIENYCQANGGTVSDFVRQRIGESLGLTVPDYALLMARKIAIRMAIKMISLARENMPTTEDEAIAMFGPDVFSTDPSPA